MSFEIFFGMFIGFLISFFVLKRSINNAGCGELKMCRTRCPYYRDVEVEVKDSSSDE